MVKKVIKKEPISKISKISKSTHNQERVRTGIKNFDSLIEGGFEKNSTSTTSYEYNRNNYPTKVITDNSDYEYIY